MRSRTFDRSTAAADRQGPCRQWQWQLYERVVLIVLTVRSKKSQLVRPMYSAGLMAIPVAIGLTIVQRMDESAPPGLPFISIAILLVGLARVLNWWFTAGRTCITVCDDAVVLRGRFRTVRLSPKEIVDVWIVPGEWRPEWSRWAVHPKVVLELEDGGRISRQILLDSNAVLREGPRLRDAIREAARGQDEIGRPGPDRQQGSNGGGAA